LKDYEAKELVELITCVSMGIVRVYTTMFQTEEAKADLKLSKQLLAEKLAFLIPEKL